MTYFSQCSMGQTADLSSYKWKNRIIILLAPNSSHKKLQSQLKDFEQWDIAQFEDRDLQAWLVTNEESIKLLNSGRPPASLRQTLDKQYGLTPNSFHFILIGKDGGIKMQKSTIVKQLTVNQLIDSMPMRQAEMKDKNE